MNAPHHLYPALGPAEEVADSCGAAGLTYESDASAEAAPAAHQHPALQLRRLSPIALPYSSSSTALTKLSDREEDQEPRTPPISPALQVRPAPASRRHLAYLARCMRSPSSHWRAAGWHQSISLALLCGCQTQQLGGAARCCPSSPRDDVNPPQLRKLRELMQADRMPTPV
jgi:hypothetical protein